MRTAQEGAYGFYANRDVVVHVDDALSIGQIETGVQLHGAALPVDVPKILKDIYERKDETAFSVRSWKQSFGNEQVRSDHLIDADITFGGENTQMERIQLVLTKWDMLDLMRSVLPT